MTFLTAITCGLHPPATAAADHEVKLAAVGSDRAGRAGIDWACATRKQLTNS